MKSLIVALTLSILAGCATFGVPPAETANEKTVFAYKAVATAADGVGILLDAETISLDEARGIHKRLTQAKEGIDLSIELRKAGNFEDAEARLASAIAILEIIQAELDAKRGASP